MKKISNKYYSKRQEMRVAKKSNGKAQINSGATRFEKGDVKVSDIGILIECKTKVAESKSLTIKKDWIEKLRQEAIGMGYNPNRTALSISFGDEKDYYLISDNFFQELLYLLRKEYKNGKEE